MMPLTREQRRRVRRTHLKFQGITGKTRESYRRALLDFFAYLRRQRIRRPKTFRLLDFHLGEYINECFQEGEPLTYAGHALSGFHRFYPDSRGQLRTAWQYFNNWQRCHEPKRALPLTVTLVRAMAAKALLRRRPRLAVTFLVAFSIFLRTGEFLTLEFKRIFIPADHSVAVVGLENTKSSRRKRAKESVVIRDRPLIRFIAAVKSRCRRSARVYPHSSYRFKRDMQGTLKRLGVQDKRFQGYSFRRGGASWYFLKTGRLDSTVVRGRWQSEKTARIYIDDAAAELGRVQNDFRALKVDALAKQLPLLMKRYCLASGR